MPDTAVVKPYCRGWLRVLWVKDVRVLLRGTVHEKLYVQQNTAVVIL